MSRYEGDGFEGELHERNNWGRWGTEDQVGAINLVTPAKRAAAAGLVKTGRTVSLSRPFPVIPAPNNPKPAAHFMKVNDLGRGSGGATDYIGAEYHGAVCTHVDALCHAWDDRGMWNGRRACDVVQVDGSHWGSIEHWKQGIITRGVLLDVTRYRGEPYVTMDRPVKAEELAAIASSQGTAVEPGDLVAIYSGRDRWDAIEEPWGSGDSWPGLHGSCVTFFRDVDCCAIAWDMQEAVPNQWDLPWTIHGIIFAYGMAIVDNCALSDLAEACQEEQRYDFMFVLSPLVIVGGTGSPANPLAIF